MSDWDVSDAEERVRRQLYRKFRPALVDRGFKRLAKGPPTPGGDGIWVLPGIPEFGDAYREYTVAFREGAYSCSCYTSLWGDSRERAICSHVMAVIIARRLGLVPGPAGAARSRPAFPTPQELGLPGRFREFRPVQVEALQKILASDKRWVLLQAPTGSGKSLIAAALQRLSGGQLLYTCHTKTLQDQFIRDFAPLAVELKGRENYPTAQYPDRFPEINCGLCTKKSGSRACRWCCPPDCYRHRDPDYCNDSCETPPAASCPYHVQKARALAAAIPVLNMALFLGEANYVGAFGATYDPGTKQWRPRWPWVVLDEGDLTEEALMNFVELSISQRMIERLGISGPRYKTKQEAWLEWAREQAIPRCCEVIAAAEAEAEGDDWAVDSLRDKQEAERLLRRLTLFVEEVGAGNWVNCTEDHDNGPWIFRPIFVSRYADRYLWRHGARWLVMSATIISREQFCRNLGIPLEQCELVDLPSTFPVENRRIWYIPGPALSHKTKADDWPRLVDLLDRVLDMHPEDKVLVHTVSYELTRYVFNRSRYQKRMVLYTTAREREARLELFKQSPHPLVMVAPSLERGVDLPDDLCRVVVILKLPYPNLGDRQVSARLYGAKDGQSWYAVSTVRSIVQMSGRGVRHDRDWCVTYILDGQFSRLFRQWGKIFPRWWREAVDVKVM